MDTLNEVLDAYLVDNTLPTTTAINLIRGISVWIEYLGIENAHTLSLTLQVAVTELSLRPKRSVNRK